MGVNNITIVDMTSIKILFEKNVYYSQKIRVIKLLTIHLTMFFCLYIF